MLERLHPQLIDRGVSQWLYVMDGLATIGEEKLGKGDAAADAELPLPKIRAEASTTLVLFPVDRHAHSSLAGVERTDEKYAAGFA
ncbi:hypothetical protein AJ87_46000 [Rhizobium yanglingense]|nr:hypothetical protein AJ87_46000 [Rhizobium yanglingense]